VSDALSVCWAAVGLLLLWLQQSGQQRELLEFFREFFGQRLEFELQLFQRQPWHEQQQ
jgi:hypothetical protein